jgi:hypothetical protein
MLAQKSLPLNRYFCAEGLDSVARHNLLGPS